LSSASSKRLSVGLAIFVLVIGLGELIALLMDYQNNNYLQEYVANNRLLIFEQTIGLLLFAIGSAFVALKVSTFSPSGKLVRMTRRISGLSPIFASVVALILWVSFLSQVFGSSLIGLEVYSVVILILITIGMMARDRITVRMSLRNFIRRKTSMAIVIAGLMIGTAMISGSLVTGDTLTNLFTRGTYASYGYADEVVYTQNAAGTYQFFDINLASSLSTILFNNPTVKSHLVGVTPEILSTVSVNDTTKAVIQSGVALIGTYANASSTLGDFHSIDGSVIFPNITDDQTIINERTARDTNATVGDQLTIFSPISQTLSKTVRIVGIAVADARGSFTQGDDVFVTISTAQYLTAQPGSANYIAITNQGGLRNSIQYTSTVGLAANQTLNNIQGATSSSSRCKTTADAPANSTTLLCAYGSKMIAVNNATTGAQSLSNLFEILSTITIVAGIVLIINMFIMLAEERKSEMGMARAVGMKRGQLTKLFLFEGTLYAAGASLVGVFVGIGIAYGILYAFGNIISSFFPVSLAQVLDSFTFTPTSLFTAFTEGLLITYLTILLTSWRVSRLNIIRAVRDIPEPPKGKGTYNKLFFAGIALVIIGILVFQANFSAKSAMEALVGPSLVILGMGLILARFMLNRYAFTITGIALLVFWGVPAFSFNNPIVSSYSVGPEVLIYGGMLMVTGAILIALYNTDVIIKLLRIFYRGNQKRMLIFKTALSYPASKRFRTGATVAMFALVILSVTTISFITAEQGAALNNAVKQDSGGYDIITQTVLPVSNLTARIGADRNLYPSKVAAVIPFNTTIINSAYDLTLKFPFGKQFAVGGNPDAPADSNFYTGNTFSMGQMADQYKTAADVWNAVRNDPTKIIWSFSQVTNGPPVARQTPAAGDVLRLSWDPGIGTPISKDVTVIGVINGVFFGGVVTTAQFLQQSWGIGTGQFGFVKITTGSDPTNVANILKRDFARIGMQTTAIAPLISSFIQVGQSFLGVFEAFLALGLVVGIAGLGIISIRSVVERRKEIGVIRAIGFRRRMVLQAFLLENSYVALLGILIGIILGIDLGYAIATSPGSGVNFVIPWVSLLEIIAFSYGLSILATLGSSRRAAGIPPAEALRYTE
jgi:putative ABC transport system permease protein